MKLDHAGYGLIPISEVDQLTLNSFACGRDTLDQFLKVDAKSFQEGRIGFTTCVFHKDAVGLVGYFTMANEAIKLNESEVMDLGLNIVTRIQNIPAVKIGKFAIRGDLQAEGNGKDVMELAISGVLSVSGPSAVRLAVVDAVNESKIIRFYESCGFKHSLFAKKQAKFQGGGDTVKMYLDVLA